MQIQCITYPAFYFAPDIKDKSGMASRYSLEKI